MTAVPVSEIGYQVESAAWWSALDNEENPDLVWPNSVAVFGKMENDAQVTSVLRAVTLPVMRTGWAIDGTGCRPEVTAAIAEDFGLDVRGQEPVRRRTRDRFSWSKHVEDALLELVYGHSFFEPVYRVDGSGMARLRKLGWRPPRTISKVNVAKDGGLESIEQHDSKRPIPVDRLVAYVNQRRGGNWLGRSVLRPAYGPWLLKNRMLRVQAQTVDRNGLGVPVYTGVEPPEGIDAARWEQIQAEDQAKGLALAKGFRSGENAGAAIPHGATLELKGVTGKLPDADPVIRYYDEQIARSVLAHFLNLGSETGSWALGSTFADFFVLSLQTLAMHIADVTNAHVIEDLVDLNFGPDEPAPRLVFEEIGARSPATAEAIGQLVICGALTMDDVLEAHLRTKYGLPQADMTTARPRAGQSQEVPADAA